MRAVKVHLPVAALVLLLLNLQSAIVLAGQSGRPDENKRESGRPDNTKTRSTPTSPPVKPSAPIKIVKPLPPKPEPRASLTVIVQPADSRVMLDGQESSAPDSRGVVLFMNLTVASHRLIVRRTGYHDYTSVFTPVAGDNTPLNIKLESLPGTLRVVPRVSDALIEVKRLDNHRELISRTGSIEDFEIPAGEYELTISKDGYATLTKTVVIQPAHSLELEPDLNLLETRKRRNPEHDIEILPMTSTVVASGKDLIFRLRGASGEKANSGSINVETSTATVGVADTSGSLSGHPCQVEFVRLENVAEASLLEAPGPSNQWSSVAIRVRPKDHKRTVHFVINWRSLERSAAVQ